MSRLILRRKSSLKPVLTVKEPTTKKPGVEFRWSVTASQSTVVEKKSSPNLPSLSLNNTQPKFCSSSVSISTKRSLSPAPVLPNINKKNELSVSTHMNTNKSTSPLSLTYSQLHRAQHPLPINNKTTERRSPIYPLLKPKRTNLSNANTNQQPVVADKFIRLRTPQLRQLHMSKKNTKEAKKLYFNAAYKVFVPHSSIIRVS